MPFIQRSVGSLFSFGRRPLARLALLVLCGGLLAGCEGKVTMDLATELPSDPAIAQIVANVRGLQFVTSSGGTETIEFSDSEVLDFIDLADDNGMLRLFTDEQLSEGNYTGVRLLFDENASDDAYVTNNSGTQFPLNLVTGDYATLSFDVEKDKTSHESFTLLLDLRKSLSFDDDSDEYTLTPILRAVKTEDMSRIEGNVSVSCPSGDSLSRGAVYLYTGEDVTPDDIDGSDTEPFATTPIFTSSSGNSYFYALRYLPAGDYTMAVTCIGNDEDPLTSEDLEFRNIVNISVDDAETVTRNLP
ncbi:DUF4382 domain-containing protein [Steroidobacter sp.]|uniref:DUF4382 domain-containing protein n=1 Tax=Steroidobacter sp. TaxID=1978227 RepID=UPI001A4620EC|nr:DUF4382 domain-containing protein [Steroidobacter sp.]MBL8267751.1 DUF4382 domain-containing protein [Steroidobacter sp.]